MPQLLGRLESRPSAPFGRGATRPIGKRMKEFADAERKVAIDAALVATTTSRQNFRYLRPPAGAQRRGRSSTGGRFAEYLTWERDTKTGQIGLDIPELEKKAPHWIILEIGSGSRARMRYAGDPDRGVPAPSARLRTVRSQRGRRIHPSLVFADGPGGTWSPPGSASRQQLFYRSRIIGAPSTRRSIIIKRDIKGQHFVQKGAQAGFRRYRESVLTAARQAFRDS